MEGSRAAIKPQSLLLAVGLVACSIMGLEAAEEVPLDALLGGSAGESSKTICLIADSTWCVALIAFAPHRPAGGGDRQPGHNA